VIDKLASVQKELSQLPINGSNYKTRTELKNLQIYANMIEEQVKSQCKSEGILVKAAIQTNIYSDRWILGNLTMPEIIKEYS
jgi:hypothetical protein